MINFFRKIRQNLLNQGKTVRYFKYAVGEVFLVVIGILIALSINNWNENRKDRIAEQLLYKTLISSLESDLKDVNDKMIFVGKAINAQEFFIVNTFEEVKNKIDVKEIENLLFLIFESSRSFFPNYGLYDKISNNNQLDLIKSTELQMEIIELYEQYYKRYNDIDLNLEHQAVFSLTNNFFSKIEDYYIKNENKYRIDFETLGKYYGILNSESRKIHPMTVLVHNSMIDCKGQIESLLSSLRKEAELNKN